MAEETRKLALIASKGTLDWAYPPFILASTAAALGWEVQIFFTFYGLLLLKSDYKAAVSPLGNPAMPMKMPFGSDGFQNINWPIPVALQSFPGFQSMATTLMRKTFESKNVPTIEELREMCVDLGVKLIGCQMTMDVFGFSKDDFISDVEVVGAATFLEFAAKADVSLFI